MRRREKTDPDGPPSRLRRYREQDWTGLGCHPECAYWAAVGRWAREHPGEHVEVIDGPDEPWHQERI